MLRIDVLTLFPEMFAQVLGASILKRAAQGGKVGYHLTDIRQHTTSKHGKVDDRPYGGGPGMVMSCQPLWDAVKAVEAQDAAPAKRILMTPQGRTLTQPLAEELAGEPRLLIIAGHYEGIDQRVIEALEPMEISIGDYVLSGGELPAMVLIDAVVRLIPGVLGHEESALHDSFSPGAARLLDHPHYTRPPVWSDAPVPPVLVSGDHAAVDRWREEQRIERTRARRPDLLKDSTTHPDRTV
jgi:tRNA (guanine37-N1)-methyltransferase